MDDFAGIARDTAVIVIASLAAVSDVRTRRIPSYLTVPGIGFGLLCGAVTSTPRQFTWLIAVSASMFIVGFVLYVASVLGGGDGKLLTCVAALTGPGMFAERMAWLLIAAVVVSMAILAGRRALGPLLLRLGWSLIQWMRFGLPSDPMEGIEPHRMPFAVVVLIGVVCSVAAQYANVTLLP